MDIPHFWKPPISWPAGPHPVGSRGELVRLEFTSLISVMSHRQLKKSSDKNRFVVFAAKGLYIYIDVYIHTHHTYIPTAKKIACYVSKIGHVTGPSTSSSCLKHPPKSDRNIKSDPKTRSRVDI